MNNEMKRIKKQAEVVADVFQIIGGAIKAVSETIEHWPNDKPPVDALTVEQEKEQTRLANVEEILAKKEES
jgi:hypothetical protein